MDSYFIQVHSLIDLITNSSTELFVVNTDKSIEFIKGVLVGAIELHNSCNETSYCFEDIFDEPYVGSTKEALGDWHEHYGWKSKHGEGVIIAGREDNSIPYWLQEFIVESFNAERFHLG